MRTIRLSTVGAVCAILTVVCFVLGGAAMAASGVQTLIPETGRSGLDWIADVDGASGLFFAGAWLIVLRVSSGSLPWWASTTCFGRPGRC
jgi:hypothetical protein